jgi:hypothetical protein
MSKVATSHGIEEFLKSLKFVVTECAEILNIEITHDILASNLFSQLIRKCAVNNNSQVAVLIDEYDAPITNLLDNPEEMDKARKILQEFYAQLKSSDEYISFVFVTGITKYIKGGLYSAFNSPTDISLEPEFGALAGFTHEEILLYYPRQLREVAESQKISQEALLEKMKEYYNGFCFDGQTFIYNPFSMLQFFRVKLFDNFWFNTASTEELIAFLRNMHFVIEDFIKIPVSRKRILNPRSDRYTDPPVYLFQLGYLSLQSSQSDDEFLLDYPNVEVRDALAIRLLESYFKTVPDTEAACEKMKEAVINRDPALAVQAINMLLAVIPYDDYEKGPHDESFYRRFIISFIHVAGLYQHGEPCADKGCSDLIFNLGNQIWIVVLKVSRPGESTDQFKLDEAITQIKRKKYADAYYKPITLALVINDNQRRITLWSCEGSCIDHKKN